MGSACCNPEAETTEVTVKQMIEQEKARTMKEATIPPETALPDKEVIIKSVDQLKFVKGDFVLTKKSKFSENYKLLEGLGEGSFGIVGKCENKNTGSICAVKMMDKRELSGEEIKDVQREIDIILEFIVTELIEGGELFDELIKRKAFSENDCALIIGQLLEALCYCHSCNIVHKDLKPENILLEKKGSIRSLKIIDFGTAQKFDKSK